MTRISGICANQERVLSASMMHPCALVDPALSPVPSVRSLTIPTVLICVRLLISPAFLGAPGTLFGPPPRYLLVVAAKQDLRNRHPAELPRPRILGILQLPGF